jgi:hypothetical protein
MSEVIDLRALFNVFLCYTPLPWSAGAENVTLIRSFFLYESVSHLTRKQGLRRCDLPAHLMNIARKTPRAKTTPRKAIWGNI